MCLSLIFFKRHIFYYTCTSWKLCARELSTCYIFRHTFNIYFHLSVCIKKTFEVCKHKQNTICVDNVYTFFQFSLFASFIYILKWVITKKNVIIAHWVISWKEKIISSRPVLHTFSDIEVYYNITCVSIFRYDTAALQKKKK